MRSDIVLMIQPISSLERVARKWCIWSAMDFNNDRSGSHQNIPILYIFVISMHDSLLTIMFHSLVQPSLNMSPRIHSKRLETELNWPWGITSIIQDLGLMFFFQVRHIAQNGQMRCSQSTVAWDKSWPHANTTAHTLLSKRKDWWSLRICVLAGCIYRLPDGKTGHLRLY